MNNKSEQLLKAIPWCDCDNHIPICCKNYIFHTLLNHCMQERSNVV